MKRPDAAPGVGRVGSPIPGEAEPVSALRSLSGSRFPPAAFSARHGAFALALKAAKDRLFMHRYRSHTCGALGAHPRRRGRRLSGWCHRIRDHGGVLFIDLRDHYGITQCVADPDSPAFKLVEKFRSEWVVRLDGKVRRRPAGTENAEMPTGMIELYVRDAEVLGPAAELPLPVFGDRRIPRKPACKVPLPRSRREKLHQNIMLRGRVID